MNKWVYVAALSGLFACNSKQEDNFTVKGALKNSDAKIVYLEENGAGGSPVIVDSAQVGKDGSFKLTTPAKEETMFSLRSDQKPFPFALVINDSKDITVNADLANKNEPYTVKGSTASQGLIDFDKSMDQQGQELYTLGKAVDSLSKLRGSDSANKSLDSVLNIRYTALEAADQKMKNHTLEVMEKSNSPVLTLYALGSYQRMANNLGLKGFSQTEIADLVNKASAKFPQNTALAEVKKKMGPKKATDFTLPDVNGKPVSLSSFRGKYVLVDFWASWCGPCRQENPNVVAAYNRFKDKNFTILGVSLDKSKDAWVEAIKNDGLAWTQVSDLKFWNSDVANLYGVNSIPYNFLVDPEGNIIAEELRGQDLVNILTKVLK